MGLHRSRGGSASAGSCLAGRQSRRPDSFLSVQDISQSLHGRDGPLSRASRHRIERDRGSRISGAVYDGLTDRKDRAVVGRRAAVEHGHASGPSSGVDVLARVRSADWRPATDVLEAVRRGSAKRGACRAGLEWLALPADRQPRSSRCTSAMSIRRATLTALIQHK